MAENPIQVTNNEAAHRYEARVDGSLARIDYEREGDRITLVHTEVPAALEGRGIAGTLAKAALEDARTHHWIVRPECDFVQAYIQRHAEYAPLVDPDFRQESG